MNSSSTHTNNTKREANVPGQNEENKTHTNTRQYYYQIKNKIRIKNLRVG